MLYARRPVESALPARLGMSSSLYLPINYKTNRLLLFSDGEDGTNNDINKEGNRNSDVNRETEESTSGAVTRKRSQRSMSSNATSTPTVTQLAATNAVTTWVDPLLPTYVWTKADHRNGLYRNLFLSLYRKPLIPLHHRESK